MNRAWKINYVQVWTLFVVQFEQNNPEIFMMLTFTDQRFESI